MAMAAPKPVLPSVHPYAAREPHADAVQLAELKMEDDYRSDALELERVCEVLRATMSRFQARLATDRRMLAVERAALHCERETADAARIQAERLLQAIEQVATAGTFSQAAALLKQNGSSVDCSGPSKVHIQQSLAVGNLEQASASPTQQPPTQQPPTQQSPTQQLPPTVSGGSSEVEQLQTPQSAPPSAAPAAAAPVAAEVDASLPVSAASMVPLTPVPSRTPPPACKKKPEKKAPAPPERWQPQDAEAGSAKDAWAASGSEGKQEAHDKGLETKEGSSAVQYKFPPLHLKRPAPAAEENGNRHPMVKDPPSAAIRSDPPSIASHKEQAAANEPVHIGHSVATDASSLASPSSASASAHSVRKTPQTIACTEAVQEEVAIHHEGVENTALDIDDEAETFDAPPSQAVPPESPIYRVMPDPALKEANAAAVPPPAKMPDATIPPPVRAAPAHRPKPAPAELRELHYKTNRSNKLYIGPS